MSMRDRRRDSGSRSAPPEVETPAPPGSDPELGSAERLAYSVDEAARLTGLSRDLLYGEMRRGNLSYLKVGRRRLITRQHLEQFLHIAPGPAIYQAGRARS
jgi:excisionase family DNA binding protein